MTSNHVRIGSFVLLLVTAIAGYGSVSGLFPFIPAQYDALAAIVIIALKEWLMSIYTPATNQHTADDTPAKPSAAPCVAALFCLGLIGLTTGCTSTSSTSPFVQAVVNPNNQARAVQAGVNDLVAGILLRNPTYSADFVGFADALRASADASPSELSTADLQGLLSHTKISNADQSAIALGISAVQATYLTAFSGAQLPTLKPVYQLFLYATANGIYLATGKPTLPLPTVQFTVSTTAALRPDTRVKFPRIGETGSRYF